MNLVMQIYFGVCAVVLLSGFIASIKMKNKFLIACALAEVPVYVCAFLYLFS